MAFQIQRSIATPWAQCQGSTLLQQLDCGIRYLDLRLDFTEEKLTFCHGSVTCGGELSQLLQEIQLWTSEHPSEIILLHFKCEWGRWPPAKDGDTDYELLDLRKLRLHEAISSELEGCLIRACLNVSLNSSLDDLRRHGNVVILQEPDGLKRPNICWFSKCGAEFDNYTFDVSGVWHDKHAWKELATENVKGLEERELTKLHITHGTLTPKVVLAKCWNPFHYLDLMPFHLNSECKVQPLKQ
jgi:hypothetical protein